MFQLGQNRRVLRPSCPPWRPSCPPLRPSALPYALLAPFMPPIQYSTLTTCPKVLVSKIWLGPIKNSNLEVGRAYKCFTGTCYTRCLKSFKSDSIRKVFTSILWPWMIPFLKYKEGACLGETLTMEFFQYYWFYV